MIITQKKCRQVSVGWWYLWLFSKWMKLLYWQYLKFTTFYIYSIKTFTCLWFLGRLARRLCQFFLGWMIQGRLKIAVDWNINELLCCKYWFIFKMAQMKKLILLKWVLQYLLFCFCTKGCVSNVLSIFPCD